MRLGSGPTHGPLLTVPEKGPGRGEVALALPPLAFMLGSNLLIVQTRRSERVKGLPKVTQQRDTD